MTESILTDQEKDRYRRQLIVQGWGEATQARLKTSRVGIAGTGGLGSPVATYLAAAGVGTLILCDDQTVELSNLNRQVLFSNADRGSSKSTTAAKRLVDLNTEIRVEARETRITEDSVEELFGGCNLIVDCLDNWPTRFLLNGFSVETGIPFLHGGIREFWGQTALLNPPESACLACFITPPPKAQEGEIPVVGAVAGAMGSLMALTALRYLGGMGEVLTGTLRFLDFRTWEIEKVALARRQGCPACGALRSEPD